MATLATLYKISADISNLEANVSKGTRTLERMEESVAKIEAPTAQVTTKMIALGTAIGTAIGQIAVAAVTRLVTSVVDLAKRGLAMAPVSDAFFRLAASIGESGASMVAVTRTATRGLIADLDLMQAANKAILLGLPVTSEEFASLGQTAIALGKAMGLGPTQAFNDLITALGRSSPLILDNLGLTVKQGEANERYASQLGKTVGQLTEAEKKIAFYNAALDAARAKVDELGGVQLTLTDRIQQVRAGFQNFTDALGVAIATSPVVNAAFGEIADAISAAVGTNQTVMVQKLIGVINQLAIGVVDVAQIGVTSAGILHRAWSVVSMALNATWSVITLVGHAFTAVMESAAELASTLPGVGSQFEGIAARAHQLNTQMRESQRKFHEQAEAALEGVKGNGAFQRALDAASDSLVGMRARMVEASRTQASSADIAERLTRQQQDVAEATGLSAAAAKKAADAFQRTKDRMADLVMWGSSATKALTDMAAVGVHAPGLIADGFEMAKRKMAGFTKQIQETASFDLSSLFTMGTIEPPSMADFQHTVRSSFLSAFSDLPQLLMKAFTGGGGISGALNALGAQIGGGLFGPNGALKGITQAIAGWGGKIGQSIASLMPGIGSLLGPAIAGLGKLFGKMFGGPSKEQLAARNEQAKFIATLEDTLTLQQRLEVATVKGSRDYAVLAVAGRDAMLAVGASAAEAERVVKGLLDTQNPQNFAAAMTEVQNALNLQKTAQDALNAALERYKFTTQELGPALANQKLSEQAQQLFQDWQVLTSAGVNIAAVGREMQGSINAFWQTSVAAGAEIDVAMRPMLEKMAEMGLLTDAAGNTITSLEDAGITFSMTMSEGFKSIVESVKELTDVLARGLGLAVEDTIEKIGRIPRHIGVDVDYNAPDAPRGVPGFAGGTNGQFVDFGKGTLAMLHGREKIVTPGERGGGGGGVTVVVNVAGSVTAERDLAETVSREIMHTVRLGSRLNAA